VLAVLFDAAGTLVHLREPVGETYARIARRHGVDVAPGPLAAAFGAALRSPPPMVFPGLPREKVVACEREWWRSLVRDVFRRAGAEASFADFERFFEELFIHFASPGAWRPGAGARDALSALRWRGGRTGVVSNFDCRLHGILAGLGLRALLDVVVLPSDAGAAKPDARIFHFALDRLGVAPARALYVGDDADQDVAGARAAGMLAIDVAELGDLSNVVQRAAEG
jgi:putative hydrolase of the HAD superfamily